MRTIAVFFVIIFAGTAALFFLDGLNKINVPAFDKVLMNDAQKKEQETIKYFADLEEKYKNDTYGGSTPEETMQLFIAALKAGDTELAAKYFVIEKQEEWKTALAKAKENGNITKLISKLGEVNVPKEGVENFAGSFVISHSIKNEPYSWSINLVMNEYTNKWKIENI